MEGERGMGAERAVLIFLLKVAILFPLLESRSTGANLCDLHQLPVHELWTKCCCYVCVLGKHEVEIHLLERRHLPPPAVLYLSWAPVVS